MDEFQQEPLAEQWLPPLARTVGGRGVASELRRLTRVAATHEALASQPDLQLAIVTSLAEGLAINGNSFTGLKNLHPAANRMIRGHFEGALAATADASLPEEKRLAAIRLIRRAGLKEVKETLTALIDPQQPQAVQLASIEALAGYDDPEIAAILLESWGAQTPKVRGGVLSGVLSRAEWTRAPAGGHRVRDGSGAPDRRQTRELLMNHDDQGIRSRARTSFRGLNARKTVCRSWPTTRPP